MSTAPGDDDNDDNDDDNDDDDTGVGGAACRGTAAARTGWAGRRQESSKLLEVKRNRTKTRERRRLLNLSIILRRARNINQRRQMISCARTLCEHS